jgi:hypothetical protein
VAGETARLHAERYRQVIRAALPAGYEPDKLDSHQATWLWRTMRAAEEAGLDIAAVADRAISGRSLTGARDLASVIDAHIRREAGPMVPQPPRPWSEQVPVAGDPGRQRYLTELAQAMDERKARIGEFAAEHAPPWAVHALGPVPGEPLARLEWEQRASHVGAYPELYGWSHDTEPVGPEPAGDSPEKRAAWQAASGAMNRTDVADDETGAAGAALGPVKDLLASCVLVAALRVRAAGVQEQAARKSSCKEGNRAACAAQSAAGTGSGTSPDGSCRAPRPGGDRGDQVAGPADRPERQADISRR